METMDIIIGLIFAGFCINQMLKDKAIEVKEWKDRQAGINSLTR